ncbi:MAG TPA: chorismate-binding protein, partial [Stenomitos sp.]
MHPLQPWYWRSLPLNGKSGSEVFATLFQSDAIAVLLESPQASCELQGNLCRYSICAGNPRQSAQNLPLVWTPWIGDILGCLSDRHASGLSLDLPADIPQHLPFWGGWLGWLGYDFAWEIETLPWQRTDHLPFPVAFWYEPACFAVLDHQLQQLWLAASAPEALDRLETQLTQAPSTPDLTQPVGCSSLTIDLTQAQFEQMVRRAQQHIHAGDIFQANLSLRFQAEAQLHPWFLYQSLQRINPSPFSSY